MPTIEELRERSDGLFRSPANTIPVALPADLPAEARAVGAAFRRFFVFDGAHQEAALRLVDDWMGVLDAGGGSEVALAGALDRAAAALAT